MNDRDRGCGVAPQKNKVGPWPNKVGHKKIRSDLVLTGPHAVFGFRILPTLRRVSHTLQVRAYGGHANGGRAPDWFRFLPRTRGCVPYGADLYPTGGQ